MNAILSLALMGLQPPTLPAVIPQPVRMEARPGVYALGTETVVRARGEALPVAKMLSQELGAATGLPLPVLGGTGRGISLRIDRRLERSAGPEGYRLNVSPTGIEITAFRPAGLFYGYQTLRQLLPADAYRRAALPGKWEVPAVEIEDRPRFVWRGAMLDPARYYLPTEFLFKFVDLLALHKLNTLHLHLTDDQGWRMQIKRYPRLTEVGAFRSRSMLVYPDKWDSRPHGGYYTQDEMRELVAYAAARNVTIIPEIELPGHAQAAIAAYPELGNLDRPLAVSDVWGVHDNVFNVEDSTIQFLKNVLDEVVDVFPSKFIHIGGDEVPKTQWKNSPRAQALMKERGLRNEEELQSWFIRQMDNHLDAKGRRLVGWDEILEGGLAEGATLMDWRGYGGAATAIGKGHDVVIAWTSHLYLDYFQSRFRELEPHQIGGYVPLSQTYSLDPTTGLTTEQAKRVLGTQAQLWGEYAPDPRRVEYLAFPRLSALAEVAWTPVAQKSYEDFVERWATHRRRLDILGVGYRKAHPDPAPTGTWSPESLAANGGVHTWKLPANAVGATRIGFFHTGGAHGVTLDEVVVKRGSDVIARIEGETFAGGQSRMNERVIDLPSGGGLSLSVRLWGSGGSDSRGVVLVIPNVRPSW